MSGVLAVGKAGRWTITIEEADDAAFSIWLHSALVSLQLNQRELTSLRPLVEFLRSQGDEQWSELDCLGGVLVFHLHDGSLFLRLRAPHSQTFEVRLEHSEIEPLADAIEAALEDLGE